MGIECVIGKLVTREVSLTASTNRRERWPLHMGLLRVLLSDDDRTLDEMLREPPEAPDGDDELPLNVAPRREVVELQSVVDLDDDDRVVPEKLLPDLPTLRSPLSLQDDEAWIVSIIGRSFLFNLLVSLKYLRLGFNVVSW